MALSNRFFLCGIPILFVGLAAMAEEAWVSDQFEVMLRSGPSSSNAIERMLPSGTAIELLESDAESGYSKVRTTGGTEGWVLSRYLMDEPSAREQLERLSSRLSNANATGSSLSSQLNSIKSEYDAATSRIASLELEKRALEQDLAEIKRTAANVLAIDGQNKGLQEQVATAEIEIAILEQQNRELSERTTRYWFVTGAGVILVGMLLGLWLPRIKWQRRSRYDRF